jgi:hypothetical protein
MSSSHSKALDPDFWLKNTKAVTPLERLGPQNQKLLRYLMGGRSLTPAMAFMTMHIGSLTSRISDLRKAGYPIMDEWKKDANGADYKSYWLEAPKVKNPKTKTPKIANDGPTSQEG